jgi:hypothetical protein
MAKLGNASDIASLKERAAAGREEYKAENKASEKELDRIAAQIRAETVAGSRGDATKAQLINARTETRKLAREELIGKHGNEALIPPGAIEILAEKYFNDALQAAGIPPSSLGTHG